VQAFVVNTELSGKGKESLFKESKAGDVLLGHIRVCPNAGEELATNLRYTIPPPPPKDKSDADEGDKEKPSLVDLQLGLVSKLTDDAERTAFVDSLIKANPGHLPALVAKLDALKEKAGAAEVLEAADAILSTVGEEGEEDLACYLGTKQPPPAQQTEEDKKTKKKMDIRKEALRKAYHRKTNVLLEKLQEEQQQGGGDPRETARELESVFARYRRWIESSDSSDPQFALVDIRRELARGRYGVALVAALKLIKERGEASGDSNAAEAEKLKAEAIRKSGWKLWVEEQARFSLVRSPPGGYATF
jgi:tripeptidyl-peptidase-2